MKRCRLLIAILWSLTAGVATAQPPTPTLADRLPDLAAKDPKDRIAAAKGLFNLYTNPDLIPKAVPALLTALKDPDDDVRLHAAAALNALRSYPHTVKALADVPGVAAALAVALGDKKVEVATRVADTLMSLAPVAKPAVPALQKALTHSHSAVRVRAAIALAKAEPTRKSDAARVLVAALAEKDDNLLVLVVEGFLHAGTADEKLKAAEVALTMARKPYTSYNQVEAACFVALLNPKLTAVAFKELARQYREAEQTKNLGLIQGVGRYLTYREVLPKSSVSTLLDLLADHTTSVLHGYPEQALVQKGIDAVPELKSAIKSDDPGRRDAALTALVQIDPTLAVKDYKDDLTAALRAPGGTSRSLADAVMRLGPQSTSLLEGAIAGQEAIELLPVASALVQIDSARGAAGVPIFVKALGSKAPGERLAGAGALAEIGPAAKPALPKLLANLNDPDVNNRIVTARAIIFISPEKAAPAIPVLAAAIPEAAKAKVPGAERSFVMTALSALQKLGPKAKEALPAILGALDDPADQSDAIDALLAIDPKSAKKAIPILEKGLQEAAPYEQLSKLQLIARLDPATARSHAAIVLAMLKQPDFYLVLHSGRLLLRLNPDAVTKKAVAAALLDWCNKMGPEQTGFRYQSIPLLVTASPVDAKALLPWVRERLAAAPKTDADAEAGDERVSAAAVLAAYGESEAREAVALVEKIALSGGAGAGMSCCMLVDFPPVARPAARAALVRLSLHPKAGPNAQQMLKLLDAKKEP